MAMWSSNYRQNFGSDSDRDLLPDEYMYSSDGEYFTPEDINGDRRPQIVEMDTGRPFGYSDSESDDCPDEYPEESDENEENEESEESGAIDRPAQSSARRDPDGLRYSDRGCRVISDAERQEIEDALDRLVELIGHSRI